MRKLITTEVALKMNWTGKRGKVGLATMDLKNVVFGQYIMRRGPNSNCMDRQQLNFVLIVYTVSQKKAHQIWQANSYSFDKP